MPRTLQVRDVDDETYAGLRRHAAAAGVTVPELLRREMRRLASRPPVEEWLERTRHHPSDIDRDAVLASLDELRGSWPDAGR
ncbi:hypothetical protein [Aquipuribacter nitratireducens]|uniref:Ribbon-helix-helix protein CopG domain-containing protein n=1 Tax=Aquipuribacter nitratireducens TaxID=650104 RepID=A0ABW0GK17_9MICO